VAVVSTADHANTVREALDRWTTGYHVQIGDMPGIGSARAALDALVAQAEQAHAALQTVDEIEDALAEYFAQRDIPMRIRQAVDAFEIARAALSAREEAWTHEDRMVLGEGGC
jgi:alpha-beta hydrolase superfamily lysophospholipase